MSVAWLFSWAASPASAAQLHEACKADMDKYCSSVTPGAGRMMACIYAHEDIIADGCDESAGDMLDILDSVLGTAGDAIAICLPDIKKHCSDTKFGQGRILRCLDEKSSELEAECGAVVGEFKQHFAE